jgi:hypothetical protein
VGPLGEHVVSLHREDKSARASAEAQVAELSGNLAAVREDLARETARRKSLQWQLDSERSESKRFRQALLDVEAELKPSPLQRAFENRRAADQHPSVSRRDRALARIREENPHGVRDLLEEAIRRLTSGHTGRHPSSQSESANFKPLTGFEVGTLIGAIASSLWR